MAEKRKKSLGQGAPERSEGAGRDLPAGVLELCQVYRLDVDGLLGWAVRTDGTVVVVAGDGRKFVSPANAG